MALQRYRIGRDNDADGQPVYVVTDHGEPEFVPNEADPDGAPIPVYTEVCKVTIHTAPYTPDGKAECQLKVLQGNAAERAANGSPAAPTGQLDNASVTLSTDNQEA